jgi:hypothetical protein
VVGAVCAVGAVCDGVATFESVRGTTSSSRVCTGVTAAPQADELEVEPPTPTSNRVVRPHTDCVAAAGLRDAGALYDSFEKVPPTWMSDAVCEDVSPPCVEGAYESAAPSATSDRVCTAIPACPPGAFRYGHST